jgi:hypothetical protein
MKICYEKIDSLEDIVDEITSVIQEGSTGEFNTCMAYEFEISVVNNGLTDVTDQAEMWANEECPKELHINHGSYIKDGMKHIIEELNSKPSSNRALFSLINQSDISGSGDNPIPSFMIFQTCIESDTLYCTSYFRALEVSTFLRINIEEIRLKILEIYNGLANFNKIRLVVFAFRGYHYPAICTLKKAKIDLMSSIEICNHLRENPYAFWELFEEKAKDSSVIDLRSLRDIKESLGYNKDNLEKLGLNFNLVTNLISKSIEKGEALKKRRIKHSHHESIDQAKNDFTECLNSLSKEFEKCHSQ